MIFAIDWSLRERQKKWRGFSHAADGTEYDAGLNIVQPSSMLADMQAFAKEISFNRGWIEDVDQFIADLQIARTEDGMDMVIVPNLVNGMYVMRIRNDFLR